MKKWTLPFEFLQEKALIKWCAKMCSRKPHLFENKLYFLLKFTSAGRVCS